jgi:organic radical activating enzyme
MMFFTKMIRKLSQRFFADKRQIGINLFSTSQCDTGCRHCLDNSDCKNPVNFTADLAAKIVEECRKERWGLHVLFTGGGETLMTPNLLEITDEFGCYERLHTFKIITSGFLESETFRKKQLKDLLKRAYAKNLIVEQSFNLYHESFPDRLANMARLIMEVRKRGYFHVRACMSLENCHETQSEIEKTLSNLAQEVDGQYRQLLIGLNESERRLFPLFENKIFGGSIGHRLCMNAVLENQMQGIRKKDGSAVLIFVDPVSFEPTGRGVEIAQSSFGSATCTLLFGQWESSLLVGPDGSVYPDCACYPDEHMRLGKIGQDSLVEIVRRRDLFAERIMGAFLADKRMCQWGTASTCTLCKQIVAERGLELK